MKSPFAFNLAVLISLAIPGALRPQISDETKLLSRDIFKQLIEINTTDSAGTTTAAAQAMAKRLLDAGFPASDVQVLGPNARKENLVARLHGAGSHKPILFICHTDVVEARREDWSLDPFKFNEKDGYFYGRGTQASEKLYADFQLEVRNTGGHSSLPEPGNAIYQLAGGLTRLEHYTFPFELNEVTRAYFAKEADIVGDSQGADMKAILHAPPDKGAIARLSKTPFYNTRMRTTCVATRLEAGHANNALPGFARAMVNCRILPGHTPDEIRAQLIKILAEPEMNITAVGGPGSGPRANPPSPLRTDVVGPLEQVVKQMWPGVPVMPVMDAGASDGAISRAAGIPTYGVPGVFIDLNDDRSHGRDERLPVASFYEGVDFYYRFTKALTSPQ